MATIPFSSIAPEEDYINTGEVEYDSDVFYCMSFGFLLGFVSYVLVVALDIKFVESGKWKRSIRCSNGFRIIAFLARVMILMLLIGILILSWCLASVDFSLILGFRFRIMFKMSFRFGLIAWASMFRVGAGVTMITDFAVTLYIYYQKYDLTHQEEEEEEEEQKEEEEEEPGNPISKPSSFSKPWNPPDREKVQETCPVSPCEMFNVVLAEELSGNDNYRSDIDDAVECPAGLTMLCSCSNRPEEGTFSRPHSGARIADQLVHQHGSAEERVILNDL